MCAFSLCTADCSPASPSPFCSLPCPQQTSSPLSSSLTTHLPWPLLEAGAVQGRASGGGARPEMVPIQCKRTSCTPCPLPFYFLPHAVTPFPPSFFSFAPWSARCVLHVRACVRAGAAGASSLQQACAPLTLHACVCVCAFPRDVFSACHVCHAVHSSLCIFVLFLFVGVLLQPGCCRHVQGR